MKRRAHPLFYALAAIVGLTVDELLDLELREVDARIRRRFAS